MTQDIKNMNETIKICHGALKEHGTKEDKFSEMTARIEQVIRLRAEQLKNMIESEKEKLLDELASRKTDRIKQIQRVAESIEQRALFIGGLVKYTEELRDNGTAINIAQQVGTLHERADELVKMDDINRDVSILGSVAVSLDAITPPTETNNCLLGNIKWQHSKG